MLDAGRGGEGGVNERRHCKKADVGKSNVEVSVIFIVML